MFSLYQNDEISSIPCCLCNGDVIEFFIPNDIWNKVIRNNQKETDKEYLCINCFFDALRISLNMNINFFPIGPKATLNIKEVNVYDLITSLLEKEKQTGRSSLEIFKEYLTGELVEKRKNDDWISDFMLFLLTEEVQAISCGK